MNWRWSVPVAFALTAIEAVAGVAAYNTKTWNWERTEVLTGWPAVRLVCLAYCPALIVVLAVGLTVFVTLLEWASRGRK